MLRAVLLLVLASWAVGTHAASWAAPAKPLSPLARSSRLYDGAVRELKKGSLDASIHLLHRADEVLGGAMGHGGGAAQGGERAGGGEGKAMGGILRKVGFLRTRVLVLAGELDKAWDSARATLALNPTSPQGQQLAALAAELHVNYTGARESFAAHRYEDAFLQASQVLAEAWMGQDLYLFRARCSVELDLYHNVRHDVRLVLSLDPYHTGALQVLADALYRNVGTMRAVGMAQEVLTQCLRIAPDDPHCQSRFKRNRALLQHHAAYEAARAGAAWEDAAAALRRMVLMDPKSVFARDLHPSLCGTYRRFAEALGRGSSARGKAADTAARWCGSAIAQLEADLEDGRDVEAAASAAAQAYLDRARARLAKGALGAWKLARADLQRAKQHLEADEGEAVDPELEEDLRRAEEGDKPADYYELLGLKREDAAGEGFMDLLKKAYRRLALLFHPDKNPDDPEAAAEMFREIAEAYKVLSDEAKRKEYDATGSAGAGEGGGGNGGPQPGGARAGAAGARGPTEPPPGESWTFRFDMRDVNDEGTAEGEWQDTDGEGKGRHARETYEKKDDPCEKKHRCIDGLGGLEFTRPVLGRREDLAAPVLSASSPASRASVQRVVNHYRLQQIALEFWMAGPGGEGEAPRRRLEAVPPEGRERAAAAIRANIRRLTEEVAAYAGVRGGAGDHERVAGFMARVPSGDLEAALVAAAAAPPGSALPVRAFRMYVAGLASALQVRDRRDELLENFAADGNRLEDLLLAEEGAGGGARPHLRVAWTGAAPYRDVAPGDILVYEIKWRGVEPAGGAEEGEGGDGAGGGRAASVPLANVALDLETSDGQTLSMSGAVDDLGVPVGAGEDLRETMSGARGNRAENGWLERRVRLPESFWGQDVVRYVFACEHAGEARVTAAVRFVRFFGNDGRQKHVPLENSAAMD